MKRIFSLIIICSLVLGLCGCGREKKEKYTDYSFDYFDTVSMIVGFEASKDIFDENCKEIKALLEEYHKLYTIYNTYEGVNNLCSINNSEGEALRVDDKILDMLSYAKKMYNKTDGKLNVAMGSVLSIWHSYREEGINDPASAKLPAREELEKAKEHTDIDDLVIDYDNKTVSLSDSMMKLDVGAVAKGYAVEAVAQFMAEKGMNGYSLNIGGNIRIVGQRHDGEKWKVGIENPDTTDKENPYIEYLMLEDMSVVTSGTYQRYYEVDGKRYHHIIDPQTLFPGENYRSVTIVCQSSALGDALSTALFTMSLAQGEALIDSIEGAEAMWVMPDGSREYSDGFKVYCVE